jgi:hypothetical protein
MQELMREKVFEISIVDIPDLRLTLVCIYRSPQIEVYKFIDKLKNLIVKIQQKGKRVIVWRLECKFFTQ